MLGIMWVDAEGGGSYLAGNVPGEIAVWRELKLTHLLGLVINYLNIPGLVERHRGRERA